MKVLFILNDPPYGTERVYNALRLAHALTKRDASAEHCGSRPDRDLGGNAVTNVR
jgi:hypothetical protein